VNGNEVVKFDPATYIDKIRDKIKQSLIDVIPDEQWNAMLKDEITSFFETRTERDRYHNTDKIIPSEFHQIARKVFEEETRQHVRDILNGPDWQAYWNGTKMAVGEEIARLARENGAAILSKWLEAAIAQVVSNIRFSNQ